MTALCEIGKLTIKEFIEQSKHKDFEENIRTEYKLLQTIKDINTYENFHLPENQHKNRYLDVPCADSSRVVLDDDDSGPSYIHANYIWDYDPEYYSAGYLATQAPLKETIQDFWRMVWQEKSEIIVMLMRMDNEKYFPYWNTSFESSLVVGKFKVTTRSSYETSCYIRSSLTLLNLKTMEERLIQHYQYKNWPDYGVPTNYGDFLHFVTAIRGKWKSLYRENASCAPIIVHCDAGVGRTGTFCAVMNALKSIEQLHAVHMFEIVKEIRIGRPLSVMIEDQYVFCYKILLYYVTYSSTFKLI